MVGLNFKNLLWSIKSKYDYSFECVYKNTIMMTLYSMFGHVTGKIINFLLKWKIHTTGILASLVELEAFMSCHQLAGFVCNILLEVKMYL